LASAFDLDSCYPGFLLDGKFDTQFAAQSFTCDYDVCVGTPLIFLVCDGWLSHRTFGALFLLLTCASAWNLFTQPSLKYLFLTMLFGAGAVLSYPEAGLHTAIACGLIWLFKG
jgi:hypothetical protein